jgi:hypothetical protein
MLSPGEPVVKCLLVGKERGGLGKVKYCREWWGFYSCRE